MVDKVTPDTAEQIRAHDCKQGRLISPENTAKIIEDAIDFYDKDGSTDTWLVVITQDCDLVRKIDDEPYVELLALQELSSKPGFPMRGHSARKLHLAREGANNITWFECNIHDRFRIKKESLLKTDCNSALAFSENEQRLLRQWLARRYARAAFPDHFENHLQSTKSGPVKKLFKSAAAKLISTVYIDIDHEDAGGNEDYYIHVILTALAEDLADPEKRDQIDDFEERFIRVFDNRPHICLALKDPDDQESYDVRVISEEDVTLSMLRRYKRFDADYRSVDDDTLSPPDGIDSN